jgi:signal recognition particle GTPase
MNCNKSKRISVIVGHYGSGKTNLAVDLSVKSAASGVKTNIVDLDIVNPYFRTADFKNMFEQKGISMTSSVYAVSNLDIPAITFDLNAVASENQKVIIDVGGDDAGAVALGQYKSVFERYKDETEVLFVINKYRAMTEAPQQALEVLKEIEAISRLKATAVVNNSNLGAETDAETVLNALDYAKQTAEFCGLELKYTTYPDWISHKDFPKNEKLMPVKRYVKALWEEELRKF